MLGDEQVDEGANLVREKVPLRDMKFTKEELKELENKTWIEMKDMIFETEPSILDYLTYHCKRWRQTKRCALSDEYNRLKNSSPRNKSNPGQYQSQGSSVYQGPAVMRSSQGATQQQLP